MKKSLIFTGLLLILFTGFNYTVQGALGNTITRRDFNFGHQSGYIYARSETAWFRPALSWSFETGFLGYYTSGMPRVLNPFWKERLMLTIPLYFELFPCDWVSLQLELTDLFVEFPYENIHNTGGKSPRFKTKIGLIRERKIMPALALTLGVKFSSAKPYTIWDKEHNYEESNGLAGAGTGVADYLILLAASKKIGSRFAVHTRIGLAPLGSPVEYTKGSAQADEIPYGLAWEYYLNGRVSVSAEIAGMYNGLRWTELAHYSVARFNCVLNFNDRVSGKIDLEHGLTEESDEWVVGYYQKFLFKKAD